MADLYTSPNSDQGQKPFSGVPILVDNSFWHDQNEITKRGLEEETKRKNSPRPIIMENPGTAPFGGTAASRLFKGFVERVKAPFSPGSSKKAFGEEIKRVLPPKKNKQPWESEKGWNALRFAVVDAFDEDPNLATDGRRRTAIDTTGRKVDGVIFEPFNWEIRHKFFHDTLEHYIHDDVTAALRLVDDDRYAPDWDWFVEEPYGHTHTTAVTRLSDHNKSLIHDAWIVREPMGGAVSAGDTTTEEQLWETFNPLGTPDTWKWQTSTGRFKDPTKPYIVTGSVHDKGLSSAGCSYANYTTKLKSQLRSDGYKWRREGASTFVVTTMQQWVNPSAGLSMDGGGADSLGMSVGTDGSTGGGLGGWVHVGPTQWGATDRWEPNEKLQPGMIARINSVFMLTEDDIIKFTPNDGDGFTMINIRDSAHFHMAPKYDGSIYFIDKLIYRAIGHAEAHASVLGAMEYDCECTVPAHKSQQYLGYMALDRDLANNRVRTHSCFFGQAARSADHGMVPGESGEWRPVVDLPWETETIAGPVGDQLHTTIPGKFTMAGKAGAAPPGTTVTVSWEPGNVSYGAVLTPGYNMTGSTVGVAQKVVFADTIYFDAADEKTTDAGMNLGAGTFCVSKKNNRVGVNTTSPKAEWHTVKSLGAIPALGGHSVWALVQNNANTSDSVGMMLLAGTAGRSRLYFADTADADVGEIYYIHSSNTMTFRAANNVVAQLKSSGLYVNTVRGISSADLLLKKAILRAANGSAATPSSTFESDLNTGHYRVGVDTIGWACNANSIMQLDPDGLMVDVIDELGAGVGVAVEGVTFKNTIGFFGSGAAATPSIAGQGDSDTGLYWPAANTLAVTCNGVKQAFFNATGSTFGGDGTNYSKFLTQGALTMAGNARATKTEWIQADSILGYGANKPATAGLGIGGVKQFSDEAVAYESISVKFCVPQEIDTSAQPLIVLSWSTGDNAGDDCRWEVAYRWSTTDDDTSAAAEGTVTDDYTDSVQANGLVTSSVQLAAMSSVDTFLTVKISRRSDNAGDTLNGINVDLHGVGLQYISNKLGEALGAPS